MKNISKFFDQEREKTLDQIDELQKAITHLRYEGKASRKKNLKAADRKIKKLDAALARHRRLQEKVIFPFLLTHIPRHEPVIHFLETEHADIKENGRRLKEDMRGIFFEREGFNDSKIYERGICLISLLRHHVGFEARNIYKSISKELREDEKRKMTNRISAWLRKEVSRD